MKKLILALTLASVVSSQAQNSPYVAKVLDFCPAPGQFTNVLPQYEEGDTKNDIIDKVSEYLVGQENGGLLSLGAWGGYIVVGFDHTIINKVGEYDFKILGNAFYSTANPNPDTPKGGSCEPGIVMVSYDENKNGLADDAWYELAGSEYKKPETKHNYEVVYYKPDKNKVATPNPNNPSITDTSYIYWKDNIGNEGYIEKNSFYQQAYYPEWIESDSLVFKGTRLANNAIDESGQGSYYVLYAYDWGYADNHPNDSELSCFKIDWAVDSLGNPVHLPGIDFIKIYTGVLQSNGWLGECSTEVSGIIDLHPEVAMGDNEHLTDSFTIFQAENGDIHINTQESGKAILYNMSGICLQDFHLQTGKNILNPIVKQSGIYLLKIYTNLYSNSYKIIIK